MLNRIFGKKPFDALCAEADRLFGREEYGRAKLAYEKANDARDASPEQKARMMSQVAACCNAIARSRMAEAARLLEQGSMDLAEEELLHAQQTAHCEELKRVIAERLEASRRQDFREHRVQAEELDEDSRYLALGGHWEEAQALEYETYGERFRQALLRLHDDHVQVAAASRDFETLLAEVEEDAEYLWFEVGRARLRNGDPRGASEAFSTFIKRMGPGEGGDTRLSAHMALATLAAEQDDLEGALNCYGDAIEAMPEDPRPYLAMGAFMRRHQLCDEAIDVLMSGLNVLGEDQPHFLIWQELGLAYAQSEHSGQAIHWLEKVVGFFAARQHFDLPPEGASTLARLHEQQGNPGRAADLFKLLSEGSDRSNLLHYHVEAARLLEGLGALEDARRMLARAIELAGEAPQPAVEGDDISTLPEHTEAHRRLCELRQRLG